MQVNVKLDKGAFMPEKAHKEDAGFDMVEYILNAKGYTLVPVKIEKAKKVMNGGA